MPDFKEFWRFEQMPFISVWNVFTHRWRALELFEINHGSYQPLILFDTDFANDKRIWHVIMWLRYTKLWLIVPKILI